MIDYSNLHVIDPSCTGLAMCRGLQSARGVRGDRVVISRPWKRSGPRGSHALVRRDQKNLPKIYLSGRRRGAEDVFASELGDGSGLTRLKWLIGTCLAGSVGIAAIGFAIYASMDLEDGTGIL